MKKIIYLTDSLGTNSGWARYSLDLIRSVADKGYEVIVLCHEENKGIDDIKQIPILRDPMDFGGNVFDVFSIIFKKGLRSRLAEYDTVHCLVETYVPLSFLISKIIGANLFVTIHGSFGLKTLINPILGTIQRFCYKMAKNIIAVSNYTKNRMMEVVDLNNIVVINNGISSDFLNRYNRNSDLKKPLIISVGAIKNRKGFHLALEVIKDLQTKIEGLKYIIIGNDKDKDYVSFLKTKINTLKINDIVEIRSNVSEEELHKLYSEAKVFLLWPISDKYNFEGFGLVYIEANSYGLPTIGTRRNGGEDAILNGKTGYLVEPDDIEGASNHIYDLFKDYRLYDSISTQAREWSEDKKWEYVAEDYIKLYEN